MRLLRAALTCAGLFSGALAFAERPNVLLIYVDDLGYGDLGSYGHPVLQTPHLDALAASGVRLTNYYAPSALCSPSRAALLTGRHPYRTGIKSWIPHGSGIYLQDQEITLAEILAAQGYATALIGKWHLNSDLSNPDEPQPNDQGFDYFYGHNAFQIPTNKNPTNIFRNRKALPMQAGYTAELYADETIAWLERRSDQPFFVMLSMAEPHTTIENPPAYNNMYAQFTRGEIVPIPSGEPEPPMAKLTPRGPGEYYANITYMDAQIGRVLAWLEKQPAVRDNTIVVFASDNGPVTSDWFQWWEVNAYGSTGGLRGRKHFLYEGGIKVPAIVRYPGTIQAGSQTDEVIIGTDLFTTLIAWTGAAAPNDRAIDGIDVRSALTGQSLPERDLLWALPTTAPFEFVMRRGPWKLLIDQDQQPYALYQLDDDPLELFDRLKQNPGKRDLLMATFKTKLADINQTKGLVP